MLEGIRIMCLFTFYIAGYLAGIAVKSYYSHNRRHVKILYRMKDSCTMYTTCMSGYIVKRQNGNISVSYHFICFLYTFVSARGGWVWLAVGGARKLRHSLTTMVRSQNPFLDHSSDRSPIKACFMPAKQIISLSVTSSHWTEVAAPLPPSHPGWNTILGRCGYLWHATANVSPAFNYTAGRDQEGVCKAYSLFPPTHHYIWRLTMPYAQVHVV